MIYENMRATRRRKGIATVWIIAAGPALLALLVLVTEIANLWLARVELRNAVEAGALAGAKTWGDAPNDDGAARSAARLAARNFTQANLVVGSTVSIALNDNGTGNDNQNNNNQTCPGSILLGRLNASVLDTTADNPIAANERACRVYATEEVARLWKGFGGPSSIQASATARYHDGMPRLTQITSTTCP